MGKVSAEVPPRGMEEILQEAEKGGLWLHCFYGDLWFSPAELRKAQSEGRFCWGPVNWTLRRPEELLARKRQELSSMTNALMELEERINREG